MVDVLCLGELLIDFVSTETDCGLGASPAFHKAPGGAPANVAAGVARLGLQSGFLGKVGDDPFGVWLREILRDAGVDPRCLLLDSSAKTTLAFVAGRSDGRKDISFWRNPGADHLLRSDEIDLVYLAQARVFHFGSVSLSHSPAREATLHAARAARARGALISYDPNLRLPLWDSPDEAAYWIWQAMPLADVVKLADEEWEFVTGSPDFAAGCGKILDAGPALVVRTEGSAGCRYGTHTQEGESTGFRVDAIDPLGAGDAFVAGMLCGLLRAGVRSSEQVRALNSILLRDLMRYANACGALATCRVGAIPALPTAGQVEELLQAYDHNEESNA